MANQIPTTGNTPAPQTAIPSENPNQPIINALSNSIDTLENINGYLGDIVEYCQQVSDTDKEQQYQRVSKDIHKSLNIAYSQIGLLYDYDKAEPYTQSEITDLIKDIEALSHFVNYLGYFTLDDIANDSDLAPANHDWLLVDSGYCDNLSEQLYDLIEKIKGGN